MWTVVACLIPPLLLSVFVFGIQVLFITVVSVISCVAVEAISQKLLGRRISVKDGSAVITGMLLAFVIPPGVSPLLPILGAVMAIYIGKHVLGGIGYNIFNPALLGRSFLLATFPVAMTSAWLPPVQNMAIFSYLGEGVNAVTTATPLAVMKEQGMAAFTELFGSGSSLYTSFFLGWRPGCIGETSGLLLVLGGLVSHLPWLYHLAYPGVDSRQPSPCCPGFSAVRRYFSGDPLLAILSGGVLLGAFLYGQRLCDLSDQQDIAARLRGGYRRPDRA